MISPDKFLALSPNWYTAGEIRKRITVMLEALTSIASQARGTLTEDYYAAFVDAYRIEGKSIYSLLGSGLTEPLRERYNEWARNWMALAEAFNRDPQVPKTGVFANIVTALGELPKNAIEGVGDLLSKAVREGLGAAWPVLAIAGALLIVVVVFKPKLT